ncbi:MAG: Hsp20/alpha crystallin family protein [Dehalococcoidales bacterium]|nr:Hsp20/alpha crystallin family protein [Dehalococcoidales bacterium]
MLRREFFADILGKMFGDWTKAFPWDKETEYLRARDPLEAFEHLIDSHFERFKQGIPSEFIKEREIPGGRVTTVGPIYYGISYKKELGKPPEIREFGNVRPALGGRRLELTPAAEREPVVEVIDQADQYLVYVEMPGASAENIDLEASRDTLKVKATNHRKYATEIRLEEPINPEPDQIDANYKNGELIVTLKKMRGEVKRIRVKS